MAYKLPKEVQDILNKFQKAGYQIYVVGGAVRDLIMGKQVSDWDFTTDAKPEEILKLFPEGFYDNKFGTVGVPSTINTSDGGRAISEDSSEVNKMDLITIDAGWTKLGLVLPVVKKFLKPEGIIIALLKPQYETEKRSLVKGVVPVDLVEGIKTEVIKEIEKLEFKIENYIESPILGGAGNQEYLLLLKF